MTDLVDEVRASFDKAAGRQEGEGPLRVVSSEDPELAPGFNAMRKFYEEKLLVIARRGYRYYAGSTLPSDGDQLIAATAPRMMTPLVGCLVASFTEGVLIGHRDDQRVQRYIHFENVDQLFGNKNFRHTANVMAQGFIDDAEVYEFFGNHIDGAVAHLSHLTGFAHTEVEPGKIWDLWLLIGAAMTAAGYLAGYQMGTSWRERDVLTDIEIATEEHPDGPAGEVGPRS